MLSGVKSIRPFVGAKDYEVSREFYKALGFEETVISHDMCVFKSEKACFYLQAYYVKDWIENTMLFLEVADVEESYKELNQLDLPGRFPGAKLSGIRYEDWGSECFLHDPSGVLWHIGEFKGA